MFDPLSDMGCLYFEYVENRARIWAEKYLGTRDVDYRGNTVLRNFHFCNIWRELDRYSRYEISMIRGRPLSSQLDQIVVGRLCMVPDTIRFLLDGCNASQLLEFTKERQTRGVPWYNTALQIQCRAGATYADMFVEHRDAWFAVKNRLEKSIRNAHDSAEVADFFTGAIPHVGPFRAYEIATSLTYSEHLPHLRENSLFMIGPGAMGGLRLLTGASTATRAEFGSLRAQVFAELIRNRRFPWIPPEWQGSPTYREKRKFTMRTLEDSLCEFFKYIKIRSGLGRRRTYRPTGVFNEYL